MTTFRFDPKSQITWEGTLAAGRGFITWWRETLREMAPQPWRQRILETLGRWTLSIEGGDWRLRPAAGGEEELLLDPAVPDEELVARIDHLAAASRDRRIDVLIPPESGLTRTVRLPAAARTQLRSVIALQLGRLSPFRADDVRFDCHRAGEEAGEMDVGVGIVPKQTLAALEQRLERLGFAVHRFRFQGTSFSFTPVKARRTSQEQLQYALGLIAIVSFAAAIILAPFLRASELDSLSSEVRSMTVPAHRAASLRDGLHRAAIPLDAVNANLARPSALDILQRLTRFLPADVQLTDLKIDGAAVRIAGYSGDVKKLLAQVRRMGEFQHAILSGPVGKAADGRERFEIEMSAR